MAVAMDPQSLTARPGLRYRAKQSERGVCKEMQSSRGLADLVVAAYAEGDNDGANAALIELEQALFGRQAEVRLKLTEAGIANGLATCMAIFALQGRSEQNDRLYARLVRYTNELSAQTAVIDGFVSYARTGHPAQQLFEAACRHVPHDRAFQLFINAGLPVEMPNSFGKNSGSELERLFAAS